MSISGQVSTRQISAASELFVRLPREKEEIKNSAAAGATDEEEEI